MVPVSKTLRLWGVSGTVVAAAFAVWMFFFPQSIPTQFAWTVEPRMAQAFIGAGYLFRTYFFLLFVFTRDYRRLRWAYAGNLAFTGGLLLATLWHAESMHWRTIAGHLWIIFYTMEPVIMHFAIPRIGTGVPLTGGGAISPVFRQLLILQVGVFGLFGLLLIINPEWTHTRWPWALNPFDARIVAAWWVGWAGWSGWMANAADWEEIRLGVLGEVIMLAAVNLTNVLFYPHFRADSPTLRTYVSGAVVLLVVVAFFYWWQERHRPVTVAAASAVARGDGVTVG